MNESLSDTESDIERQVRDYLLSKGDATPEEIKVMVNAVRICSAALSMPPEQVIDCFESVMRFYEIRSDSETRSIDTELAAVSMKAAMESLRDENETNIDTGEPHE